MLHDSCFELLMVTADRTRHVCPLAFLTALNDVVHTRPFTYSQMPEDASLRIFMTLTNHKAGMRNTTQCAADAFRSRSMKHYYVATSEVHASTPEFDTLQIQHTPHRTYHHPDLLPRP